MLAPLLRNEAEVQCSKAVKLDQLAVASRALLNHLRLTSLECRTSARADLFDACAVLSNSKSVAKNASAEVLMRCLGQALGKAPKLFRPGVSEVSFDEAWLLRATEMASQKDWDSFEFLLRSRVPAETRRNLASLIVGISEQFSLD